MKERQITITLGKAREWYNSDNEALKKVALQAFSEEELNVFEFTKIKTFEDALKCFSNYNYDKYIKFREMAVNLNTISRASAAMYKLNIVRKVLNTGYDMHLTKGTEGQSYTWYPYIKFITKNCTYYNEKLKYNILKKIGEITSEGITYDVLNGDAANNYTNEGLGYFDSRNDVGYAYASFGFLGCATKQIAEHFGNYFGTLILEAMYGDMVNFYIENNVK